MKILTPVFIWAFIAATPLFADNIQVNQLTSLSIDSYEPMDLGQLCRGKSPLADSPKVNFETAATARIEVIDCESKN